MKNNVLIKLRPKLHDIGDSSHTGLLFPSDWGGSVKANVQSAEYPERAEILLFTREDVALKLNR